MSHADSKAAVDKFILDQADERLANPPAPEASAGVGEGVGS